MLVPIDNYRSLDTMTGLITINATGATDTSFGGYSSPPVPVLAALDGVGPLSAVAPYNPPTYQPAIYTPAAGTTAGNPSLVTTLEDLERKIPGIGGALARLTAGFDSLPLWEKAGIAVIITAAIAFIGWDALLVIAGRLGVGAALSGIRGLFGGGAATGSVAAVPAGFSPAWSANGVQFYRSPSGMLGVLNKKGRWKQWRPRKPIVLYANGAPNIRTLLKAEKALKKQARSIELMIGRHHPRPAAERKIPMSEAVKLIEAASR